MPQRKTPAKTSKTNSRSVRDVLIIGGGPAGLSLARALAPSGLKITVIEKSPLATLKAPKPDGRDIALTHLSRQLMIDFDMWDKLPEAEINPIHEARVINGTSPYFLQFNQPAAPDQALGFLVPNCLIRAAVFESLKGYKNVEIIAGIGTKSAKTNEQKATVTLEDGRILEGQLLIAADSRFSQTREQLGLKAEKRAFGRTVIVCRMSHEKSHQGIAHECFIDRETLAILPLFGHNSSVVITLPDDEAAAVMALSPADFGKRMAARFEQRLGKMTLTGERHPYPLVATYAQSFHGERFALVGDAAVGMHPVTAHGFNFGLRGAADLAQRIIKAHENGSDIASPTLLRAYTLAHRRATRPLYLATNALVGLYTREDSAAKLLRTGLLHLGNALPPVKKLLMNRLTELPAAGKFQ